MRRAVVVAVLLWSTNLVADRMRDPSGKIVEVPPESVAAKLEFGYAKLPTREVRCQDGGILTVYEDQLEAWQHDGCATVGAVEMGREIERRAREDEWGWRPWAIVVLAPLSAGLIAWGVRELRRHRGGSGPS